MKEYKLTKIDTARMRIANFLRKHILQQYYFGACYCGNEGYYFNVGRSQWFCCDKCKTKWLAGCNIFSGWRYETKKDWERNAEKYAGYQEIEPAYNLFDRMYKK